MCIFWANILLRLRNRPESVDNIGSSSNNLFIVSSNLSGSVFILVLSYDVYFMFSCFKISLHFGKMFIAFGMFSPIRTPPIRIGPRRCFPTPYSYLFFDTSAPDICYRRFLFNPSSLVITTNEFYFSFRSLFFRFYVSRLSVVIL